MDEVYLICFFVGLFFTVISALVSGALGGGHDADSGIDVDVDHDFDMGHDFDHSIAEDGGGGHVEVGVADSFPGLSPWSPTILSSFVTTFGGVGYLMTTDGGYGLPASLLGAGVAGVSIAAVVFFGMNKVFSALQSSSDVRVADLIGRKARVITPIPENGVGEISYEATGTRLSAPARTPDGRPVGRAEVVKIVRIVGTTYFVKPV